MRLHREPRSAAAVEEVPRLQGGPARGPRARRASRPPAGARAARCSRCAPAARAARPPTAMPCCVQAWHTTHASHRRPHCPAPCTSRRSWCSTRWTTARRSATSRARWPTATPRCACRRRMGRRCASPRMHRMGRVNAVHASCPWPPACMHAHPTLVTPASTACSAPPAPQFVKGDIQSMDLLTFVLAAEQIDTVMHFAAQVGASTWLARTAPGGMPGGAGGCSLRSSTAAHRLGWHTGGAASAAMQHPTCL
jgi:hypothetical protein